MPSKDMVKQQSNEMDSEDRPFTVFFVNPETPEEVHTDTIMAKSSEDALVKAAQRHRTNIILHVRGIGDNKFSSDGIDTTDEPTGGNTHFPCARFINGEFHPATFSDDLLLETLSD